MMVPTNVKWCQLNYIYISVYVHSKMTNHRKNYIYVYLDMFIEIKTNHRKNYIYISLYVHRDKNKP